MLHFKWTKAHAVFLPQVDAEHRNLYRMADEIHQAVRAGVETARVLELIRGYYTATQEHFSHEERLMKAASCPDFAWHKQQHDNMLKRVANFVKDIELGNTEAPMAMLEYIARWFKDHMGLTDRLMGAHVRNHERLVAKLAS